MKKLINKVKLKGNTFSLKRKSDGAGDSGKFLSSYKEPKGKEEFYSEELVSTGKNGEIHIGCRIHCGNEYTWRSTTAVQEILSVNKDKTIVKFKTRNSIYIAKVIKKTVRVYND